MPIRTKIVCTLGPSVNTLEKIYELIDAGMNVARLNFSHGTHEEHLKMINLLKEARENRKCPLAMILDTKGPEVRIGSIKDGSITLKKGQKIKLLKEEIEGTVEGISITPGHIIDSLKVGNKILFDDGNISSEVIEINSDNATIEVHNNAVITSRKGVNIPNTNLNLPAVTEKDIKDIEFGCEQNVDIIAASFVRSPEHIIEIKELISKFGHPEILIIAKIENHEGVEHFDHIIQVADGVMIARGDLGVEVPLSDVPRLQKMMIRKASLAGKPSITATHMLESMISKPLPTRAEVSDVANAIYDSTSAVMLSGETAVGKYPIETVMLMKDIIKQTELDFNFYEHLQQHMNIVYNHVPAAITFAIVKTAYTTNAKVIFTSTYSGYTARLISRLRPKIPIVALTPNMKSYHQMALNWGVFPIYHKECQSAEEAFTILSESARKLNFVNIGDLAIMTSGTPYGISGTTNSMILESIGDVLVRAKVGYGQPAYGNVSLLMTPDYKKPYEIRGRLIVIPFCNEQFLPLIQECAGVILENNVDDEKSEKYALELGKSLEIPIIIRADHAMQILKEGQLVTIDPKKGLIYKRVVL